MKVDHSHRVTGSMKQGDGERRCVITAELHYDGDAADILRRARDQAQMTYNGKRITIFLDYTYSVAK